MVIHIIYTETQSSSLSNNTVVTISQPYVNPYDTSIRDKYVFKKDYSSEIKDKLNDNWKIKSKYYLFL